MLLVALLGFFACVVFAFLLLEIDYNYRKGEHHDED